jgi:glycosyltransferase involved in cell wall biosynthesis
MLKVSNPFFWRRVLKVVAGVQPDVVHVVFEQRFLFPHAFLLHRNYPMVVTIHEPKAIPNRGRIANVFVALIQYVNNSLLAKSSDKIIIHGTKLRSCRLISKLPGRKIEVVPHGDFSFFAHLGKMVEAENNNILFFGRIAPYKGLEYLIGAGKLVENQIPNITITIAGEGDFARYESLINCDSHFVVHNRFIPDDEVAELFRKAAIVILPYTDGTQSGIISIAGAFKKPVVVTDVGSFSEMVENGKTGLVVPPEDATALAEAIIRLVEDDRLRQDMGENAYKTLKEKFSWGDIAQQTLKVYQEAIKLHDTHLSRSD